MKEGKAVTSAELRKALAENSKQLLGQMLDQVVPKVVDQVVPKVVDKMVPKVVDQVVPKIVDQVVTEMSEVFHDAFSLAVTKTDFDAGMKELKSDLNFIKHKQFEHGTSQLAYDRKVMSLDKRVTALEANV